MKVCKKCKKHLPNKTKICKYCGADVSKAKIIPNENKKNKNIPKIKDNIKLVEEKNIKEKEEVKVTKKIETNNKENKKNSTSNLKEKLKSIGQKIISFMKKLLLLLKKFLILLKNLIKKGFTKLKLLIKKKKKEKKEKKVKENKPIIEYQSVNASVGIISEILEKKEEKKGTETTIGIPIIVTTKEPLKENIKIPFKKILRSIKVFIIKISKNIYRFFKNIFLKIHNKIKTYKEKRKEKKLEKEKVNITKEEINKKIDIDSAKEEQDYSKEDTDDEYEGYSIKKIVIFIILVLLLILGITFIIKGIVNYAQEEKYIKVDSSKTYKMNELLYYNGMTYKVTDAYSSTGSSYKKPKEGNQFVVVTISFENRSKDKQPYSYKNWHMNNSKEEETSRIFTPINVDTALYSGSLVVGASKVGSLVFEEPIDDKELILYFYSDKQLIEMEKEKQKEEEKEEETEEAEEKEETKKENQIKPIFKVKINVRKESKN